MKKAKNILDFYVKQKLSSSEVAEKIGVSKATVLVFLRKHGVVRSMKESKKILLEKENKLVTPGVEQKIRELYVEEKFSGRRVAKQVGFSLITVQRVLEKYGVVRNFKQARKNLFDNGDFKHPFKKQISSKKVIDWYIQDNMSLPQIARKLKCSLAPLLRILKEEGISTKTPRGSHLGKPNPSKGKKRPEMSRKRKGMKFSDEHKHNLSKAHKGQKSMIKDRTYEEVYGTEKANRIKSRLVETHVGSLSSAWQGGVSFYPYLPEFNSALKREIRNKYADKCQMCNIKTTGETVSLLPDIHHVNYRKHDNREANLILLCRSCHAKTNYNREYWFAYCCHLMSMEPENQLIV